MLNLRSILMATGIGLVFSLATAVPAQAITPTQDRPTATKPLPMAGEQFRIQGDVVDPKTSRTVYLQVKDSAADWRNLYSQSTSTGHYDFLVRITKNSYFRVASPGAVPETDGDDAGSLYSVSLLVPVAKQGVAAWITRGCGSDNKCGGTAFASGYVRPVRDQRLVVLQILSGKTWKKVAQGRTNSTGDFKFSFSIGGWPQWTARRFRVVAGSYAMSPTTTSSGISFMPGPTQLGPNVLRVDVDGGYFPLVKGPDYRGFATLSENGEVKINRARLDKYGVRGSSTAKFAKKPYNMRFATNPGTEVFGMKADTSWTLLAMFIDQSFVRDKTALDLARKLVETPAAGGKPAMTWAPDSRYVEMFVNSEYKGLYLLTEKVKIDGDRVDTGKNTGMILEIDGRNVSDPTLGFRAPHGQVIAFKEPDNYDRKPDGSYDTEGVTPGKLAAAKSKINAVESVLYGSVDKRNANWKNVIEPFSAVDFYLAMEFIKDNDSDFWRSKFFSWDTVKDTTGTNPLRDGRLHFGPVWDSDRGAGNQTGTSAAAMYLASPRGWSANGKGIGYADRPTYKTHWYVQMWKIPEFRALLQARWKVLRTHFYKAWSAEVAKNKAAVGVSASNDRRRWASEAKWYDPKGSTYDAEVQFVATWMKTRYIWMNSQLDP